MVAELRCSRNPELPGVLSDSESSEEGHESAQTPTSPETALAAGHRRPDACAAQVPEASQLRMTPKIAPTFDGLTSSFEYEDCIDNWLNLTTLTPRKHGPSLKNSLVGAAAHYKGMLENRSCSQMQVMELTI